MHCRTSMAAQLTSAQKSSTRQGPILGSQRMFGAWASCSTLYSWGATLSMTRTLQLSFLKSDADSSVSLNMSPPKPGASSVASSEGNPPKDSLLPKFCSIPGLMLFWNWATPTKTRELLIRWFQRRWGMRTISALSSASSDIFLASGQEISHLRTFFNSVFCFVLIFCVVNA